MKLAIIDDYQDVVKTLNCFGKLKDHDVRISHSAARDLNSLVDQIGDAEALIPIRGRTPITEELVSRLPALRLISQTGKSTSHIDLDACRKHSIVVCGAGDYRYATAELTFALMLASMRHIVTEADNLRNGIWQTTLGRTLRGLTLGILGYGSIGSAVAGYGKAFGMDVVAFGRNGSLQRARADGFEVAASKDDLFARADIVSLHVALGPATSGMVTRRDLAMMKPSSLLVNTSRAALIVEGALVEALKAGRPGFAAIDVFEQEPIFNADHPLLHLSNALCTPHLGYVERTTYEMFFGIAFDQVLAYASGELINRVN